MSNFTDDQELFIREAELEGLSVDTSFTGPYMQQASCPAVRVSSLSDFRTNAKGAQWTKDGEQYIIYCPATYW